MAYNRIKWCIDNKHFDSELIEYFLDEYVGDYLYAKIDQYETYVAIASNDIIDDEILKHQVLTIKYKFGSNEVIMECSDEDVLTNMQSQFAWKYIEKLQDGDGTAPYYTVVTAIEQNNGIFSSICRLYKEINE